MEKLLHKVIQQRFIKIAQRLADDLDECFQTEVDFTLVVHTKDRKVTHISTALPEEQIGVLQEIIELMKDKKFQIAVAGSKPPADKEIH